jgi:hypothetical protein
MDGLSLVAREAVPELGEVPSEFSVPRDVDDDDLLGIVLGRVEDPEHGPTIVVCFASTSFGVPVPHSPVEPLPLVDFELRPWQIRHATPVQRAGATVFAGLLALVGAPTSALAAATRGFVGTQAITAQPVSVPEPVNTAPVVTEATPTPAAAPAPAVAPAPTEAVKPSVTGNLDDAFEGLRGADVRVKLIDGSEIRGTLWGVTPQSFTLVDRTSGNVTVYRRAAVTSIHVEASPQLPPRGLGMLITGSVLTATGVPTLIAGAVFVGVSPSYLGYGMPPLVIGAVVTAVGIALVVVGQRRNTKYRRAVAEARPRAASRRPQWTGGLSFRF